MSSCYVVVIVNGSDRFFESMDRAVGVVFTLSSTFHFLAHLECQWVKFGRAHLEVKVYGDY